MSCIIHGVSGSAVERLAVQGLKCGLDADIWAHFGEEFGSDVPDRVVPNGRHGPFWTAECMVNTKGCPHEQCCGSLVGVQPNLRRRASVNACLFRL